MKPSAVFLTLFFVLTSFASARGLNRYQHYLLNFLVVEYSSADSAKELASMIGKHLRKEDEKRLFLYLKSFKTLPKFTRTVDGFTVDADGMKSHVDLSGARNKTILIDGKKFLFDARKPLYRQVEEFVGKPTNGRKTVLLDLLLPEAQANPIAGLTLLGLLKAVGAFAAFPIAYKVIDYYGQTALDVANYNACWLIVEYAWEKAPDAKICRDYANEKQALAKKNAEATLASVTQSPIEITNEVCSHQHRDKIYKAAMFFVKEKTWFLVIGRPNGAGKVEKLELIEFQDTGNVLATYYIDPQTYNVSKVTFPDPNEANNEVGKTILEMAPGKESSDTKVEALRKKHAAIAGRLVKQVIGCEAKSENSKAAEAKAVEAKRAKGVQ